MRLLDSSETINLCSFEDHVVLVVNVASRCGYTYQYASLQKLYEQYKDGDISYLNIYLYAIEFVLTALTTVGYGSQSYSTKSE